MFLQRSAFAAARRAAVRPIVQRSFTTSFIRSTSSSRPPNSCPHTDRIHRRSSTHSREQLQRWQDQEVRRCISISSLRELLRKIVRLMHCTEIKSEADLIGPGAAPGTVPTDLEQATGLERLEILGKMQGIDIFDMKPLDASRKGMA